MTLLPAITAMVSVTFVFLATCVSHSRSSGLCTPGAPRGSPLSEVWATLNAKLRGHYQYDGINDNWPWLMKFRRAATRRAYRWLNRRSQSQSKNWRQFHADIDRLPLASPSRLTDLIALARSR